MANVAEDVARRSYGKLIAFLAARNRDVAAAEDALSEAFAAALESWPHSGTPHNPEAWLLTAARRKMIDQVRRLKSGAAALPELQLLAEELQSAASGDGEIPDRRLGLMFACAHPAIDGAIRAPLILQTLLGFDAATIASAFLVSPSAMGQRLVRAKARIRETGIPFRVPEHDELGPRVEAVLDAIYASFGEGWSDPLGTDLARMNLTSESIWLARLVVELLPEEAEALGLLALMLHAEARRDARRAADGAYVPLAAQDPDHWSAAMIAEAEQLLFRASQLNHIGRYQLEAAVQSAHAARRLTGFTDWPAIARLYEALSAVTSSPVIAINRAVAVGKTLGPDQALAILDGVAEDRRLEHYQPYWAVRASLLAERGVKADAIAAYRRAIGLESDPAVRGFLQSKLAEQES